MSRVFRAAFVMPPLLSVLAIALCTGCASNDSGLAHPTPAGDATVTVLSTSTANNILNSFTTMFKTFTLTSKSGKTVSLISGPILVEFMHVNGRAEPLFTARVPADTYTSAAITLEASSASCATQSPGTTNLNRSNPYASPSSTTVNVTAPITLENSSSVGLALDLLLFKAESSIQCLSLFSSAPTTSPVFNLSPIDLSTQPTNGQYSNFTGLEGEVASVDPSGKNITVVAYDAIGCPPSQVASGFTNCIKLGPVWQVYLGSNTVYQGISGPAQLAAGQPVDLDASLQLDGTLQATRVEVADTVPDNLSLAYGPAVQTVTTLPTLLMNTIVGAGPVSSQGGDIFNFSNAKFQISGQFGNVQQLPFKAAFTGALIADGQKVLVTSHATQVQGGPAYDAADTVMLLPQTVDGTVTAVSTAGSFDTYTVTLPPYDLFPDLDVQPGQTTRLSNPNTVVVYADNNTLMRNTNPPAVGSILRFYGLIFNDNGTLRMDCAQVSDGVAE